MTPERWRKLEELYHAADQRDPSERAAFLADACHGDDELRLEIEALLAQDPAHNILNQPAAQFISGTAPSLQDNANALAAGDKLGPYEILAWIGTGGMGEVYQARDSRLGRMVAVKVLPADKVADPARKRRFLHEARAASALNHPGIVVFHDVAQANGIDFLVLEYVEGKTLLEVMREHRLSVNETLQYALQIADALAAAHSAGIIHRDLKPSNLMITPQGRVKVLDFGIAKLTEEARVGFESSTLTEPGMLLGSAGYMSPEQAEGKPVDTRSDIFSFGAVLYEMLTGRSAFQSGSPISTLARIIQKDPPPMSETGSAIPPDLEKLNLRCLRKDPERRFQFMSEVRAALQDLQAEGISAPPATVVARQQALAPWLIAAAAVFLAMAALWYSRQAPAPLPDLIPLTTDAGRESDPVFSPDGNSVAYSWDGDRQNNFDIYVRKIGDTRALRLTTDSQPDVSPAWSPDGTTIAFLRQPPASRATVILIPAQGGIERTLAVIDGHGSLCWSPDSKWLFVEDRTTIQVPESLYAISVASGERKKLTGPPADSRGDRDPAVSPEGRTLAFVRTTAYGHGDLFMAPLHGFAAIGNAVRVTYTGQITSRPVWLPGGKELIVVGGVTGNPVLQRVAARERAEPVRIGYAGDLAEAPALSPDGHRLVYVRLIQDSNIWRVPVPEHVGELARPEEFIASTREDFNPRYSPDGTRVAFVSNRTGAYEIWVAGSDGLEAVAVTSFGGPRVDHPRWSAHGERILFDCDAQGEPRTYQVNSHGGAPQLMETQADYPGPGITRDGMWSISSSENHRQYLQFRNSANGVTRTVTEIEKPVAPGLSASPDGRWVLYSQIDHAGSDLMLLTNFH